MIQRIQTVYLLIAAVCAGLMIFLPLFQIKSYTETFFKAGIDFIPLAILLGMLIMDCLIVIFFFKKRALQMTLIMGMNILVAVILGLMIFYWKKLMDDHTDALVEFKFTALFGLVIYLLLFLSRRAIKKDDELVKSLDRLR